MKILSISGILPISNLIKENDIIFRTYDFYLEKFPDTEVHFIRTIPYSNFILSKLKDKWRKYYEAINREKYTDHGYKVTVFPFFIFKTNVNISTFLSKGIYYQNINRIKDLKEYDLIHAQRIFSEGYLAYKLSQKFSIPYIITARNETKYLNNSLAEKRAEKVLNKASCITTISVPNYSVFKQKYPAKTHLIPHGIDESFFSEQSGSDRNEPVQILTIARLLSWKRIEAVIEALSKLKDKYELRYTVIGEGPLRESIEQSIKKHSMQEYVEMIPQVPHEKISEFYDRSDIFVLVSYPEAFGRVYLEAMASAVPIICSKGSGVHGLYEEGVSGFTVDHTNEGELQKTLEKLIRNKALRLKVGKAGQKVARQYTWPEIIMKYHDIYQSVLESHS